MPSFYVFSLVCFFYSAVAFLGLLANKHTAPQITPPTTKEPTVTPNPTAAPAWWTELSAVPDNTWVFTRLRYQRVARVVIAGPLYVRMMGILRVKDSFEEIARRGGGMWAKNECGPRE